MGWVAGPRSLASFSTTGLMSWRSPCSTVKLTLAVLSSEMVWMISSTTMLAEAMSPKMVEAMPGRSGTCLMVTRMRSFLRAAPDTTMCSMFLVSATIHVPFVVLTVAHVQGDVVLFGEFDGARLEDGSAQAGKLEHLVVGD